QLPLLDTLRITICKICMSLNTLEELLPAMCSDCFCSKAFCLPPVFENPVCKVYRFQTVDNDWMTVREQMTECTLSFSIPRQLLALYVQEDMGSIEELKNLGELSPHWDNLRKEVIAHYGQVISSYQETLGELTKLTGPSFKPSCCKGQKYLEFVPINLHTQRMHDGGNAFYDVITVGAPAAHFQGFKNGGLQRLLSRYETEKKNFSTAYQCIYFSPGDTSKAREVLANIGQLQPLILVLADRLLEAAQHGCLDPLKEALQTLSDKVRPHPPHSHPVSVIKGIGRFKNDGSIVKPRVCGLITLHRVHWNSLWRKASAINKCKCKLKTLLCSSSLCIPGEWQEKLYPLVITLKDCVAEVVDHATKSMAFVLLQEAACSIPQGLLLKQRRDVVFSQALAALTCGFVMKLYAGLEDKGFLQQLHTVGLVAQFESLLSTYSEEIGMLEDMEVGISDLQRVTFRITEAESQDPAHLQPVVSGRRDHYTVEVPLPHETFEALPDEIREGKPLQVYPVLFNVGINEQQTIAERFGDISLQERINQKNFEILDGYYKSLSDKVPLECLPCSQTQTDLKELLETLGQNVVTKKRKNVEILWLAGTICRRLNGIRFTSCKSAKDRTSMSVTLEQCALLRDEHHLNKDYFIRALDCMRREGCRIENVQKNIRCRKYAFNMLQLMAFPKCYRPPEGTYGRVDS
uniref:Inositol polyphosphate-4-phosphatase type II B n=1 Tax=Scleropages formosus TaxID=113540 RepID=A0A8C9U861_SCLFO